MYDKYWTLTIIFEPDPVMDFKIQLKFGMLQIRAEMQTSEN